MWYLCVVFTGRLHWPSSLAVFTDRLHWSSSLAVFTGRLHWPSSLLVFTGLACQFVTKNTRCFPDLHWRMAWKLNNTTGHRSTKWMHICMYVYTKYVVSGNSQWTLVVSFPEHCKCCQFYHSFGSLHHINPRFGEIKSFSTRYSFFSFAINNRKGPDKKSAHQVRGLSYPAKPAVL